MARLLVVVLLASLGWAAPAAAATRDVAIADDGFTPAAVTVVQGTVVRWTNHGSHLHNSTSDQGFWRTPNLGMHQSASAAFPNAGGFAYRCTTHTGLRGIVRVPLKAAGASDTGWKLRWSSLASVPTSRSFDVQVMAPGTTAWRSLRVDTRTTNALFNPRANGTWKVRARTDNRSNGLSSGWSPVRSLRIS